MLGKTDFKLGKMNLFGNKIERINKSLLKNEKKKCRKQICCG